MVVHVVMFRGSCMDFKFKNDIVFDNQNNESVENEQ